MVSDHISDDIPVYPTIYLPKRNFEYGYPLSNTLLQFPLKLKRCRPHQAARHPRICDVIKTSNYFQQYIAGYTVAKF